MLITFFDINIIFSVQEKGEGSRRLTTVISPGRELVDFTKVLIGVFKGHLSSISFSGEKGHASGEERGRQRE